MLYKLKKNQHGMTSWLLLLIAIALVIVSIIFSTFVYKFAYRNGYYAFNKASKKTTTNETTLNVDGSDKIRFTNQLLKKELETAQQERDITLKNLANLQVRVEKLTVSNLQLKQTNDLYGKNIARQGGIPLQIIGAKIEPLPENAFEYRFDVLKLSANGRTLKLRPQMELLNSTSFVDIPIKPSSYDIAGVARIRGRFVMPDGFTPKQVRLKLKAGGESIEQLYNWKFGKRKNNVPLSLAEIPETDQRPIN